MVGLKLQFMKKPELDFLYKDTFKEVIDILSSIEFCKSCDSNQSKSTLNNSKTRNSFVWTNPLVSIFKYDKEDKCTCKTFKTNIHKSLELLRKANKDVSYICI